MLKYHDGSFQVTDKMEVLFGAMSHNKEKWINQYSTVVDCEGLIRVYEFAFFFMDYVHSFVFIHLLCY